MIIGKRDTDGTKSALIEGEFGYDQQGADRGRVYIGTNIGNVPLAKLSELELRADKYLASQNIAGMIYDVDGNLTKIRYTVDSDIDYEVFSYSSGDLSGIAHYIGTVLKGNSVLNYTDGNLSSVIFTEV